MSRCFATFASYNTLEGEQVHDLLGRCAKCAAVEGDRQVDREAFDRSFRFSSLRGRNCVDDSGLQWNLVGVTR
jgi:hypothetical protein